MNTQNLDNFTVVALWTDLKPRSPLRVSYRLIWRRLIRSVVLIAAAPVLAVLALISLMVLLAPALYFIPTIIGQGHRDGEAIFIFNLVLGWTLLGWVIALGWAVRSRRAEPRSTVNSEAEPNQRVMSAAA